MPINTYSLDLEAGSSQYAAITDAAQTGLDLATTFTLQCWINFETNLATDTSYAIISKDDIAAQRSYDFQYSDNTNVESIQALVSDNAGHYDFYKWAFAPTTGTWYHLALTCDTGSASATTFELFIDTVSQGNGTALISDNIASVANTTAPFRIGAFGNNSGYLDGKIDDVRVYTVVRSQAQIAADYQQELTDLTNVVGYWKLNNDYSDQTTNNNDLTASGSPVFSTDVPFVGTGAGGNPMFFSSGGLAVG